MLSAREHYEQVLSKQGELEIAQRTPKSKRAHEISGVVYTHGRYEDHVSVEEQLITYTKKPAIKN